MTTLPHMQEITDRMLAAVRAAVFTFARTPVKTLPDGTLHPDEVERFRGYFATMGIEVTWFELRAGELILHDCVESDMPPAGT